MQSGKGLAAVRPKTGEAVWNYDEGASTTSSSALDGQTIYVPSHGLTALAVVGGDVAVPIRWRKTDISPGMPSPIYFDGRVYSITGGPILVAADAKTGKLAWRIRLKGTFYASPIAADGKLYVVNDDGLGQIITLDAKRGTISSERDFKESVMGTPALSGGALYIRSARAFVEAGISGRRNARLAPSAFFARPAFLKTLPSVPLVLDPAGRYDGKGGPVGSDASGPEPAMNGRHAGPRPVIGNPFAKGV